MSPAGRMLALKNGDGGYNLWDYEQEQVQAYRKKRRLGDNAELTLDQEEAMLRHLPGNLTDIQTTVSDIAGRQVHNNI